MRKYVSCKQPSFCTVAHTRCLCSDEQLCTWTIACGTDNGNTFLHRIHYHRISYTIGLGILIGILDLVPYLHTFALIPTAFLALMKAADTGQNFWVIFASAVAIFAIVQIIIDMIVTPRVMGKAMGMNPAILLLSLSVWGSLLGFIGLIIALPLTTIILTYWKRYVSGDNNMQIDSTDCIDNIDSTDNLDKNSNIK